MKAKTVELHLLQSFPPSCVNRDGNNSPKDCTFGSVRRARISSQCLKRAIRQAESFALTVNDETANRSKRMRDKKLVPYLVGQGLPQQEAETTADSFRQQLAKDDKKPKLTSVGLYFGDEELFALLDAHRAGDKRWKEKGARKSADVALFGRMLAEATDLGVDAAAQVAHAISTHKLSQEMDYWTAVDDLKDAAEADDAGADMLGTAEFNASVFYRYACINLDQLGRNLGEKTQNGDWQDDPEFTRKTVEAFLLASYDAVPTGKLNGHAHFSPPSVALTVVRTKGVPLNLCNAFLDPIRPKDGKGIALLSADAMLDQLARTVCQAPVYEATHAYASDLAADPRQEALERLREQVRRLNEPVPKSAEVSTGHAGRLQRRLGVLERIVDADGYKDLIKKTLEDLR